MHLSPEPAARFGLPWIKPRRARVALWLWGATPQTIHDVRFVKISTGQPHPW